MFTTAGVTFSRIGASVGKPSRTGAPAGICPDATDTTASTSAQTIRVFVTAASLARECPLLDTTSMVRDDDARIDVTSEESLRYWSENLRASKDELRRMVDQVGPKVKDVREHLFGGFNAAGPTS